MPPEPRQRFVAHLEALRSTLMGMAFAWVGGMVAVGANFDAVLGLLKQPLSHLKEVHLITLNPLTGFYLAFQIVAMGGALLAAPLMLLLLIKFLAPALKPQELRWGATLITLASVLFIFGVLLGWYFILPTGIDIALQVQKALGFELLWSAEEYFNLVAMLPVIAGATFCIPLVIGLLIRAGVIDYRLLEQHWEAATIAILIIAAAVTPTGDPVTFLFIAGPLAILYALAVKFGKPPHAAASTTELP